MNVLINAYTAALFLCLGIGTTAQAGHTVGGAGVIYGVQVKAKEVSGSLTASWRTLVAQKASAVVQLDGTTFVLTGDTYGDTDTVCVEFQSIMAPGRFTEALGSLATIEGLSFTTELVTHCPGF